MLWTPPSKVPGTSPLPPCHWLVGHGEGQPGTGGLTLSGAVITQERPHTAHRVLVGALFAVHRRVVVRLDLDYAAAAGGPEAAPRPGPEFCTCGDVWPCRIEDAAARILDRA